MLVVANVAALIALGIESYVFTIGYPVFALLDRPTFARVRAFHAARITWSIGPALLIAAGANAALVVARPAAIGAPLPVVAALAGIGVLAITAFVQIPLHARLAERPDDATIRALIRNERARALATFVQAAADVAMLALVVR